MADVYGTHLVEFPFIAIQAGGHGSHLVALSNRDAWMLLGIQYYKSQVDWRVVED